MVDIRKTPSLQHMAALTADSVDATVRNLERFDAAKIKISLNPGRRLFKPLMEAQDLEWALRQLQREKAHNILPNIGLLEAFAPYAEDKRVGWFRECEKHFFPIGPGVAIPVQPTGFWNEGGVLKVLWVQAWKGRTLDPFQRALFNTILRETFFVGDFKGSPLEWLDLRQISKGRGREIEVLNGDALGFVSREELTEILRIFLTAFEVYAARKEARKAAEKGSRRPRDEGPNLFDRSPED
jgi:hypothetical protein